MKIKKLIADLQDIEKHYGDINVFVESHHYHSGGGPGLMDTGSGWISDISHMKKVVVKKYQDRHDCLLVTGGGE